MYSVMDDSDPMLLESRLPYPKTLDKTVLVARAKEIQEVPLPENAVHEKDVTSGHGDGAETEPAQEQGPTSFAKPNGKDNLVDDEQREGSDNSSLLRAPAGGTNGGAEVKAGGGKKRKTRSKELPVGSADGENPRVRRNARIGLIRKLWAC